MKDFDVFVLFVFVEYMLYFQNVFRDVVLKYILYKYSEKMRLKSKKVNFGIFFKNENKSEDMIDILRYLQGFVFSYGEGDEEKFE